MALIKLLIFDEDDEYSISLCNFLTHSYSETLMVNYCNNPNDVREWAEKIDPDILLTSDKYYLQIRNYFNKNLILLSSRRNSELSAEAHSIYKYKDANQIVGEIINIFTRSGKVIHTSREKDTKAVAVYSAAGNVGKTSLALAVSSICSFSGLSVFYLNLEQFQSTNIFFTCNNEYSMSDIIYFAKEKDKNLITKIPVMCSKDADSSINYFGQVNNVFDIKELHPQDIDFIISAIRECGYYDLVVIDMDSQLNENSIKIFEKSDEILYVVTNEENCLHKTKLFIEAMNLISDSMENNTLSNKIKYAANKVSKQALLSENPFLEQEIISNIIYDPDFPSLSNLSKLNGGSEIIINTFKDIARRYLRT